MVVGDLAGNGEKGRVLYLSVERERTGKPGSARERAEIAKVIRDNWELLSGLETPSILSVLIEKFSHPQLDSSDGLGRIITPDWIFGPDPKKQKHARTLLSHELGHWIFFENAGRSGKGAFSEAWRKAWEKRKEAVKFLYEGIEGLKQEGLKIDIYHVGELAFEQKQKYRALTEEFLALSDTSMPYQELFCDLLAVLYQDDAGAVADAMPELIVNLWQKARLKDLKGLRDFSNTYTPKAMLKLEKELREDPHYVLAPVRGFIGARYLKRARTVSQKRVLLEAVFQAIQEELNFRFDSKSGKLPGIRKIDAANERLIDRIEKLMDGKL